MCFQVRRQKLWRREVQAKLPAGDGRLQPRAVQVAQPAAAFERDAGQEVGGGEGNGRGHQGVGEARSRGRQGALSSARRVGPGRRNEGGRLISNHAHSALSTDMSLTSRSLKCGSNTYIQFAIIKRRNPLLSLTLYTASRL